MAGEELKTGLSKTNLLWWRVRKAHEISADAGLLAAILLQKGQQAPRRLSHWAVSAQDGEKLIWVWI